MADLLEPSAHRTAEPSAKLADLESFAGTIAHDLRAPLRAIHGYAAMLREDYASTLGIDGTAILIRIEANANQMARMIDGLLDYSRLGHADPAPTEIDTQELVSGVARALQGETEGRKPQVLIDALPPVRGDAAMLRQVWFNLLSNAIKFSSQTPEPRIEISAERRSSEVVFSVRDNGAGFDMTYAEQIFGVFNRLHAADEFPGVGMGLAIVRRIVVRHGGRTWAQSDGRNGATFFFSLPI
jgi:light-regulated signal transduction histidine kinase (bacteriophytochrome)